MDYTNITISDMDILQKVSSLVGEKFKIVKYNSRKAPQGYIYSKKVCNELVELFSLCSNKSDKLVFPKLEDNLMPAFISGYLAADGCISIYQSKYKAKYSTLTFYSCSHQYLIDLCNFIEAKTLVTGNLYERNRSKMKGHLGHKPLFTLGYNWTKAEKVCKYIFDNTAQATRSDRKYKKYYDFMMEKYGSV
jgi:hypothetical protein